MSLELHLSNLIWNEVAGCDPESKKWQEWLHTKEHIFMFTDNENERKVQLIKLAVSFFPD